jgi:hypothetical protein
LRRESPWLRSCEHFAVSCLSTRQNEYHGHFCGVNRSSQRYASMAESSMPVRPRGSPEILHTCIATDTDGFGKNGTGHKRQAGTLTGMLATARGTKLSRTWNNQGGRNKLAGTNGGYLRASSGITRMTQLTPAFTRARVKETGPKIIGPTIRGVFQATTPCRCLDLPQRQKPFLGLPGRAETAF